MSDENFRTLIREIVKTCLRETVTESSDKSRIVPLVKRADSRGYALAVAPSKRGGGKWYTLFDPTGITEDSDMDQFQKSILGVVRLTPYNKVNVVENVAGTFGPITLALAMELDPTPVKPDSSVSPAAQKMIAALSKEPGVEGSTVGHTYATPEHRNWEDTEDERPEPPNLGAQNFVARAKKIDIGDRLIALASNLYFSNFYSDDSRTGFDKSKED
jgi:CBS domain-containing protein